MDPMAMGEIAYSADGHSASSKHFAYKFAGYPNLLFKCSISICQRSLPMCKYNDGTPVIQVSFNQAKMGISRLSRELPVFLTKIYAAKFSHIKVEHLKNNQVVGSICQSRRLQKIKGCGNFTKEAKHRPELAAEPALMYHLQIFFF